MPLLWPAGAAAREGARRARCAAGRPPGFEHLARLVARDVDGVLHAAPIPNSATLAENIRSANAFLAVPAGVRYEAGDKADIELLGTKAG